MGEGTTTEIRKRGGSRRVSGMILQIILSSLCILVGALLLFVPEIQVRLLCYVFCIGLIVTGVVQVARFFLSEAYNNLSDYSFASGILFLILGICGLLRIGDLEGSFELYLGFAALVIGTVILQEMVQLRILGNWFWILLLIFNVVILAGAVLIIVNAQQVLRLIPGFTYWVLFIGGIASLLSLLITAIVLHIHRKRRDAGEFEELPEEEEIEEVAAEVVPTAAEGMAGAAEVMPRPDVMSGAVDVVPGTTAGSYAAPASVAPAGSSDLTGTVHAAPETLEQQAAGDGWTAYPDLFDADANK